MKTDLIYGVEDRPPFKDALFAALQHLLAIFVAIITPRRSRNLVGISV